MENLTLPRVIDLIKERHDLKSDYQVCKLTDINTPVMSGWRAGKSLPDERMCAKLAEAAGIDPLVLAAAMQAQRSRTPEARNMWEQIAERLALASRGAVAAIFAVAVAIGLVARGSDDAGAAELHVSSPGTSTDIHRIYYSSVVGTGGSTRTPAPSLPSASGPCTAIWALIS